MSTNSKNLTILLVEDDEESLNLLMESLPKELMGYLLYWEPCLGFDEAERRVTYHRYDLVVTDIYIGGRRQEPEDNKAHDIITRIRRRKLCPVIVFTSGSFPESINPEPFLKLADKSKGNSEIILRIEEIIETGIPEIAGKLHKELDGATGPYLWDFLKDNWPRLSKTPFIQPPILERIIRRRAAMQIGRLIPEVEDPTEIEHVSGAEYYIYPSLSGRLRQGEIVKHNKKNTYSVILTPHCYLNVFEGEEVPRADQVMAVKAFDAKKFFNKCYKGKTKEHKQKRLPQSLRCPARSLGAPEGRFCFLPGFLEIPDLYCDLLQLESIPYNRIVGETKVYARIAVLDTPFAEALQSCLIRFYSNIGLPELDNGDFQHMIQE